MYAYLRECVGEMEGGGLRVCVCVRVRVCALACVCDKRLRAEQEVGRQ